MAFCGHCGKQAGEYDTFCTGCGAQIQETQVSVLEETGSIIKEEYRQSTAPPEAELSRGTHIGDQKRLGEWLEYTVENILRFAGYQTMRQFAVSIDDQAKDKFFVDVLATDPYVEIFVECKDYGDTKLPEKILFEFIGQLNHYRKMTSKNVIGILAMTARADSRSKAFREKLGKENAYLWDGSFIEHLQNKMNEVQTRDEFHSYVVNHLNVDESAELKQKGDMTFIARCGFYTVQKHQYIGKKFDVMNIIDDIKKHLHGTKTKVAYYEMEPRKTLDGTLIRYLIHVDFSCSVTQADINDLASKKKKGLLDRFRKKNPVNDAFEMYIASLLDILKNVYGINYVPKSKDNFEKLYYEGGRIA